MVKVAPWQCPSAAPVPPQGAPDRSGSLGAQPLPRVLERGASNAGRPFPSFVHPGVQRAVVVRDPADRAAGAAQRPAFRALARQGGRVGRALLRTHAQGAALLRAAAQSKPRPVWPGWVLARPKRLLAESLRLAEAPGSPRHELHVASGQPAGRRLSHLVFGMVTLTTP